MGKFDHIQQILINDLAVAVEPAQRMQNLVARLREFFDCGAVALLELKNEFLCPVAIDGLTTEALGRRFSVAQHPRFGVILGNQNQGITRFPHDSVLPDPYDGLLLERLGECVAVHDCVGVCLYMEAQLWGVLTLDTLQVNTFTAKVQKTLHDLLPVIHATIYMARLETATQALNTGRIEFFDVDATTLQSYMVGQSDPIVSLLHELDVVADSELPVLLLGETGVGKELFARRLHQLSRRKNGPLVHVNCAALPESLVESELFGHTRGAFSGAVAERRGRFDAAHTGTLLLDEVGELPLSIQAKLLRTLQGGEVQRLGEDKPRHVDVRIIAATNRNLRDLVRDGAFRADLYHRLSVYPVLIPPLRERGNDILLLAGRFLEINRSRLGVRSLRLSAVAQGALCSYSWPGNVRELEHVISRAAIRAVSRGAKRHDIVTLEADMLGLHPVNDVGAVTKPDRESDNTVEPMRVSLREAVATCQRQTISSALDASGGNWVKAAKKLNIDASNLHKLARKLGMK